MSSARAWGACRPRGTVEARSAGLRRASRASASAAHVVHMSGAEEPPPAALGLGGLTAPVVDRSGADRWGGGTREGLVGAGVTVGGGAGRGMSAGAGGGAGGGSGGAGAASG